MNRPLLLIFTLVCLTGFGQKNHFLVDNVNVDQLHQHDVDLLDSTLNIYHSDSHDTTKLTVISILSNELYDEVLWPQYNQLMFDLAEEVSNKYSDRTIRKTALKYKSEAINNFGYIELSNGNKKEATEYFEHCIALQEEIGYKKGLAHSLNNLGAVYFSIGEPNKAIEKYKLSLEIELEVNDHEGAAQSYNNIGTLYKHQGNIPLALEYYRKGLELEIQVGDLEGEAQTLSHLGSVHKSMHDLDQAYYFYSKSLDIHLEIGYKEGIGHSYNSLGTLYYKSDSLQVGIDFFMKALEYYEEVNHVAGISGVYNNLGSLYESHDYHDEALSYFLKSLEIRKDINDRRGLSSTLNNIAKIYLFKKNYTEAYTYAIEGYAIAKEISYPDYIKSSAKTLSEVCKNIGKHSEALTYYEEFILMRDSLSNEESQKAVIHQQYEYEYARTKMTDSLEHVMEIELAKKKHDVEMDKKDLQIANDKMWRIGLTIGIILLVGLVFVFFRGVQEKKKDNQIISQQKQKVEEQKLITEEKNKEIIDSIQYAKKIQQALLQSEEKVGEHLPPHFIYFAPKDIVSGDFYWTAEKNNTLYFAVADCTGHGVPGAFMSMLGIAFLNEIVTGDELLAPDQILNQLRTKIIKELHQTGRTTDMKDGMDISLVKLDLDTNEIEWAGAYNPIWIVSSNTISNPELSITANQKTLTEIKADRQPIGYNAVTKDFTNHKIQLSPEDLIYIFTDGFADQFGGPKRKKFKYKPFKELLLSIHHLPMDEQRRIIEKTFSDWKGDLEQIDDICILGMKL